MPLLTFVLAVHREQAYLRECAASILDRDGADVELVAIDDASPDHAPELLDALAEADPRVQVRHLEERVGAGEARNLGLELATGDHVWFVNTTDRLPPGAVDAVADRLRDTEPDVLLLHHSVTGPLGKSRPGPHAKLLERLAAGEPGPLDAHPGAARAAAGAWSKVFSRALLEDGGARSGRGRGGERAVPCPALLGAEGIAALPQVAYARRTPPNAVRDEPVEGSAFDVFAAYDAALDFAQRAGVPDARRRLVLPAMLRHELALLEKLPDDERREFFQRMSAALKRHRR